MNQSVLAPHVLRALFLAQVEDRRVTLDDLVESLAVRRADVRTILSSLDRAGLVDVLRMKLTLMGFTLGQAFAKSELAPLRTSKVARAAA